jgi:hypothetical protein
LITSSPSSAERRKRWNGKHSRPPITEVETDDQASEDSKVEDVKTFDMHADYSRGITRALDCNTVPAIDRRMACASCPFARKVLPSPLQARESLVSHALLPPVPSCASAPAHPIVVPEEQVRHLPPFPSTAPSQPLASAYLHLVFVFLVATSTSRPLLPRRDRRLRWQSQNVRSLNAELAVSLEVWGMGARARGNEWTMMEWRRPGGRAEMMACRGRNKRQMERVLSVYRL